MKKNRTMQANNFINGAFITTMGIVIAKILGILYAIPFYGVVGEQGGALYGYAYTIYTLFMSLSTAGIPLAISKITSEYQTLGYYSAKKKAFLLGRRIALILGVICFIVLIIFAPSIAQSVLGDVTGGNTVEDVALVIRVISSAILIVPILSIYRGYFEGHRFMTAPSISQVIEQIVRVLIIVIGSYIVLRVLHLSTAFAVSVALLGATIGGLVSYLYLVIKMNNHKSKFNEKIRDVSEPIIPNKNILKKLAFYAIPFILIDIFKNLYGYIDMVTVVKGLVNKASFLAADAEAVQSMLSTWCSKFNMIILSVSSGVVVSLIPNLTQSFVKNDMKDCNKKINQSIQILLFLTIPMTIGLSFLAKPVWTLFYGPSTYGPTVLAYFIFVALFQAMFTLAISTIQVLKDYKTVFISLFVGVVLKALLNTNLIVGFYKLGLPAFYGPITSTIIAYLVSYIICAVILKTKFKVDYEESVKSLVDILFGTVLMTIGLFILSKIIPVYSASRIINLLIIAIYAIVGMVIYFIYAYKTKLIENIFGSKLIGKVKGFLKIK